MIGDKRCGNCKFFFKQTVNPSECHYLPPKTTVLLLGVQQNPKPGGTPIPILHHVITRDMTHEAMEACGMYMQKIALQ